MAHACYDEIRAASGLSDLSDDEAQGFADAIKAQRRKIVRERGLTSEDALRHAAAEAAEQHATAAMIEKRNVLLNFQARVARRQRIVAAPSIADGIKAEIHGINTPVHGGRFSAEAEYKALSRVYSDGLVSELEKANLFGAVRRGGTFEREWTRELFELSKGEDGKPGITGNAHALAVAKIVHRYQTLAKTNLNQAGAAIGDYAGYVTRTAHDADKIRRAGFDSWRDTITPQLDPRTFDGVEDRGTFLQHVYHSLITGVHLTEEGMQGWRDPAFSGPGNLAKRLSEGRVLHFENPDSWLDYQKKFGNGSIIESVVGNLDRAARSTALMRRWGTNPRAEFAGDLRYFAESQRDKNPDAVIALRKQENTLQHRFDFLDGTANQPVNALGARISSTARLVESMAKLGGVALTHLSSAVSKAAELRYHGVGLLDSYSDVLQSMVRGRGHGETRELMDLIGAGHEGMRRDLISRFEPDDGMPGTLSKLAGTFFKMSGLSYLVNAQKAGAEYVISRHLGSLLDHEHAALPASAARLLDLYRITPEEWNAVRAVPDHAELGGRKFLTPDAATRIAGMDDRAQQGLGIKLHALFNDIAERSIITPGIPERALLLGGTRPGSILGEALRMVAQFKSWPLAAIRQGIGREVYGGQSKGVAIAGLMHMAVAGTVIGYLISAAKDLAKGQTPRDPRSPATWLASFAQGGGAGILGDFLFGETNRLGQGISETLLGPVLGSGINGVLDLWNDAKAGKGKDIAPEALRLGLDNAPFANLVYLRTALNYLFLYNVQNALSPGFLKRHQRALAQQGQRMWLSPAGAR